MKERFFIFLRRGKCLFCPPRPVSACIHNIHVVKTHPYNVSSAVQQTYTSYKKKA